MSGCLISAAQSLKVENENLFLQHKPAESVLAGDTWLPALQLDVYLWIETSQGGFSLLKFYVRMKVDKSTVSCRAVVVHTSNPSIWEAGAKDHGFEAS